MKSYTPTPEIHKIDLLRDWKSWLDTISVYNSREHLKLHGYLRAHQFKFFVHADDEHARMVYKRWARDEVWHPVNPDTPPLFMLMATGNFEEVRVLDVLKRDSVANEKTFDDVFLLFSGLRSYVDLNQFTDALSELKLWRFGPFVDVDVSYVISIDKKWALTEAEKADLEPAVGSGGGHGFGEDGGGDATDQSIGRDDVETDDEHLVYQGTLHSADTSQVRHKNNFVDVDSIVEKQFLLVRNEEGGIWLCRVVKPGVNHTTRTVKVHWYDGRSLHHVQQPQMKASTASSKAKNVPFTQDISLDTVLVSEVKQLTSNKTVPKRLVTLAEKRLSVFMQVSAQLRDGESTNSGTF